MSIQDKLESFIKLVYKKWKSGNLKTEEMHPDEEALVCFLEGRLPQEENEQIQSHLLNCDGCAEILALSLEIKADESREVPRALLEGVKNLILSESQETLLEIALRVKDKTLEIINTTGDILMGQELVPAPLLRSRQIKDFKDEVTILKDFKDIRVKAKVENKGANCFAFIILVKDRHTQRIIKDLRISLLKDGSELESYLIDTGSVTFEHVFLGKYTVEISMQDTKLASILLDIRV